VPFLPAGIFPGFRSLRRPAVAVGLLAAAIATGHGDPGAGLSEQGAASIYSRGGAGPTTGGVEPVTERAGEGAAARAERIVAGGLVALSRVDALSLRLRQKVRIGDRVLVGGGRYLQIGRGEDMKFRFESALECDSESFEHLEISDGLFCWRYQRNGSDEASLQRLDVRRVQERLVELGSPRPTDTAAFLGGLQRTLWLLREWFEFHAATADVLEAVPVWWIEGRWRPGSLAFVVPELQDRAADPGSIPPADLPDGVPWSIRIAVAQSDLLPRRIEWLAIPGPRPVAAGPVEPIAVLELFDVACNGPVDPAAFFYQPAAAGLVDLTDSHTHAMHLFRP